MKILFLSDDFPPNSFGGAGIVAYRLAQEMRKYGHEAIVVTTVQNKPEETGENFRGLKIYKIYSNYHERWRAYLSIYNPQTVKRVESIIKKEKPDIVHAHNIHKHLSYYSLFLAKKYHAKVFLTAHDTMLFHYGKFNEFVVGGDIFKPLEIDYRVSEWQLFKRFKKRYNLLRNFIIKLLLRRVDKIVSISEVLKKALEDNGIKNTTVIYNGVDIDNWVVKKEKVDEFKKQHNLQNKKIILFGGRLSQEKGAFVALEALRKTKEDCSNVVLLVMGKRDSVAERMQQKAKKIGVRVIFAGWLDGDKLKAAYHASDIVITPSIYFDPFNLINIEAMACKKPVIGTCLGGTPEIVRDNKTGYVINPFNASEFSEKIVDLLKNMERNKKFGKTGYEIVCEFYYLPRQARRYLDLFKKFLRESS